jgi:hypothetical protein
MSDLSDANTIKAIPIPNNKSEVDAFLDDIFERALDSNDSKRNNAKLQGLNKRIKGSKTKDDSTPSNHEKKKSTSESQNDKKELALTIPNKDFEYSRILKTFLCNKPYFIDFNKKNDWLMQQKSSSPNHLKSKLITECSKSVVFNNNWAALSNTYSRLVDCDKPIDRFSASFLDLSSSSSSLTLGSMYSLTACTTLNTTGRCKISKSKESSDDSIYDASKTMDTISLFLLDSSSCEFEDEKEDKQPARSSKSELKTYLDSIGYSLNSDLKVLDNLAGKIKGGIDKRTDPIDINQDHGPYVLFQNQNTRQLNLIGGGSNRGSFSNYIDPTKIALMQTVYTQLV